MPKETIYKQILDATSEEEQLNMMVEEMGELLQAIGKYNRAKKNGSPIVLGAAKNHLCEEVADVENMINQMRYMFDDSMIDVFKDMKLERIKNRLGL